MVFTTRGVSDSQEQSKLEKQKKGQIKEKM